MSTNNHGYVFTKNQKTRKILQVWCDHLSGIGRKYWVLKSRHKDYIIFMAGEMVRATNNDGSDYRSIPLEDMLRDGWVVVEEH